MSCSTSFWVQLGVEVLEADHQGDLPRCYQLSLGWEQNTKTVIVMRGDRFDQAEVYACTCPGFCKWFSFNVVGGRDVVECNKKVQALFGSYQERQDGAEFSGGSGRYVGDHKFKAGVTSALLRDLRGKHYQGCVG